MLKPRTGFGESWFRNFGEGFDNLITEDGLQPG